MLQIKNLIVAFQGRSGAFKALENVSLTVEAGEIHGLVGESGSGKTTLGSAIIGLLQKPGYIVSGSIHLGETDLTRLSPKEAHNIRGKRISMIFQDPQTSLNPLMTIESQLVETILTHQNLTPPQAQLYAIELLQEIGLHDARTRMKSYPHQFSGGMRQRVVIALSVCTNPELIIADEPTTALDVAVQSQVLALMKKLARTRKIGFILITHDIGVIAQITDNVTLLRHGKMIESGPSQQILYAPSHPYTKQLLAAVPPLDRKLDYFLHIEEKQDLLAKPAIISGINAENWLLQDKDHTGINLTIKNLTVKFSEPRSTLFSKANNFVALEDICLTVEARKVMGLVGESGSGKSTLAKTITGLVKPATGNLLFGGVPLAMAPDRSRKDPSRRLMQMIFQDPYSSLNARHRIQTILSEPLWLYQQERDPKKQHLLVASILELVGLPIKAIDSYPHQFSGGQRQRIAIARVLLARPRFLICDEPTSALDVSIQAQILNLLKELQRQFGLTMLFITHNLAVVRQMADDISVLQKGRCVETGRAEEFFAQPRAEYSKKLLALTPTLSLNKF